MTKKTTGWTPYGLEAIRIAHLRRRRLLTFLILLGFAALWAFMFQATTTSEIDISTDRGGNSEIRLDVSGAQQQKNAALTISIDPGRVTRADTGAAEDGPQITRAEVPTFNRGAPINWGAYAILYGPYLLVALALLLVGKRKKHEINYGIYKGSLPYEMLTATATRQIFTTREAHGSIFGKLRNDYLPPEVMTIERMPVEEDT